MRTVASGEAMFASYAQLARALVKNLSGLVLLDARLAEIGHAGTLAVSSAQERIRALGWLNRQRGRREPALLKSSARHFAVAVPLERTEGRLLGVLCLELPVPPKARIGDAHVRALAQQLQPVLASLRRELAARQSSRSRMQTLTERTSELEWLFKVTSDLKGGSDERRVLEGMLKAATERLKSTFGVLVATERRLYLECVREERTAEALRSEWRRARQHLMNYAQRQRRPLVINSAAGHAPHGLPCKMLVVPLIRESGRVIGLLTFLNPAAAPDYETRHVFLARHLGRQAAGAVDAQFDLLTGLYTRDGLEEMYRNQGEAPQGTERSVVYVDVDHMHVVNELHGFELGNEVIVRVADALGAPVVPRDALVGRIAGDRFAIVLAHADTGQARQVAERIQQSVGRLVVGPAANPVEISVSCGVAALVRMPQGLQRALAAAELACKVAKGRGGHRIEMYACEDDSMMRQHEDVVAVGRLREALKTDRLVLYGQRIAPLQDPGLPGGYEILLRLRNPDGSVSSPGPLIKPAERYQLLPSVDRWVMRRALEQLGAYRAMLQTRGISMSINLSGQSMGDEALIAELAELLDAAQLPAGCITIELTEQAAVRSLERANQLMQGLRPLGVHFALDDFGTGANSLTYLNALPLRAVKIDGSFVREVVKSPRCQATVRGIVELARGFSVVTVAEFVETEEIAAAVRALGVDYAQGYAFGMPEPLEGILQGLANDESQRLHRLFLAS